MLRKQKAPMDQFEMRLALMEAHRAEARKPEARAARNNQVYEAIFNPDTQWGRSLYDLYDAASDVCEEAHTMEMSSDLRAIFDRLARNLHWIETVAAEPMSPRDDG